MEDKGPIYDPGTVVRVLKGPYRDLYGPIVEVDQEGVYTVLVPSGYRKNRRVRLKEDEIHPQARPPLSTVKLSKALGLPTRTLHLSIVVPERIAEEIREASDELGREFVQKLIEDRLRVEFLRLFKGVGRKNMKKIKVFALFRAPDTMALWGVTHPLRPGQSPGDLFRAQRDWTPPPPGTVGSSKQPHLGWVWLGSPGWWGSMPKERRKLVEEFAEKHPTLIPESPFEWTDLEEFEVEFAV